MSSLNKLYVLLEHTKEAPRPEILDVEQEKVTLPSRSEKIIASRKQEELHHGKSSFHNVVLSFRNDVHSPELAKWLMENLTYDTFQELQEESVEVLLPMMASWLGLSVMIDENLLLS